MGQFNRYLFLPPNPFRREPIKDRANLAGRSQEISKIDYYLNLTASGHSQHLALIGERGMGKTSLLNVIPEICETKQVLCVSIDLDEGKTEGTGVFWINLYLELLSTLVDQGIISMGDPLYLQNIRFLSGAYSEDKSDVLKFPEFVGISGGGRVSDIPNTLIVSDLKAFKKLLFDHGYFGIAFLIDEANCLGNSDALLQQIRNVFQKLDGMSLVLAGTEGLFPALSVAFSPMPRQFVKLDVVPFRYFSQISELIATALPDNLEQYRATRETVEDLFLLTNGSLTEVQLYLHHMYKAIEEDGAPRLQFSPLVFRRVISEFLSISGGLTSDHLSRIEELPAWIFKEAKWLAQRNLRVDECLTNSVFLRELVTGKEADPEDLIILKQKVEKAYNELYHQGLTEDPDSIAFKDEPITSTYWKSYAKSKYQENWQWSDDDFSEALLATLCITVLRLVDSVKLGIRQTAEYPKQALADIRAGKRVRSVENDEFFDLLNLAMLTKKENSKEICDVSCQIFIGTRSLKVRFIALDSGCETIIEDLLTFVKTRSFALDRLEMALVIDSVDRFEMLSDKDMHKLARVGGHRLPDEFGPNLKWQALDAYEAGDLKAAREMFHECLLDRFESECANNIGFLLALEGNWDDAHEMIGNAYDNERLPLYLYNLGVIEAAKGDIDTARIKINQAYRDCTAREKVEDRTELLAAIVVAKDLRSVTVESNLSLRVACLCSMASLNLISSQEIQRILQEDYEGQANIREILDRYILEP